MATQTETLTPTPTKLPTPEEAEAAMHVLLHHGVSLEYLQALEAVVGHLQQPIPAHHGADVRIGNVSAFREVHEKAALARTLEITLQPPEWLSRLNDVLTEVRAEFHADDCVPEACTSAAD